MMSEVKKVQRWDLDQNIDCIMGYDDGRFVSYEDYEALQQDFLGASLVSMDRLDRIIELQRKLDAVVAENALLKEANQIALNILNDEDTMVTSLWASSVQEVEVLTPATDAIPNALLTGDHK